MVPSPPALEEGMLTTRLADGTATGAMGVSRVVVEEDVVMGVGPSCGSLTSGGVGVTASVGVSAGSRCTGTATLETATPSGRGGGGAPLLCGACSASLAIAATGWDLAATGAAAGTACLVLIAASSLRRACNARCFLGDLVECRGTFDLPCNRGGCLWGMFITGWLWGEEAFQRVLSDLWPSTAEKAKAECCHKDGEGSNGGHTRFVAMPCIEKEPTPGGA